MSPSSTALQKDNHGEHSARRYRRIAAAAFSSFFGKGITLIVSAVTVPLTLRYLGVEAYGLWVTISSTILMFFVLDLGIATTLTNLISEAYAADDKHRAAVYFATALWGILLLSAILAVIGWMIWPHIEWGSLFHLSGNALAHEASRAIAAAFIIFLLALPTNLASKVLGGYQELHAANVFAAGGSVLSLIGILLAIRLHGSLCVLVVVYAGSAVIANAACLVWICSFHKPWLKPWLSRFDPNALGKIFRTGGQFFIIQLAGLAVFNSDNVIISHYLSPAQVTPYSVTWRLVGYLTAIQGLILPSLWPAFAESWSRGNMVWIRLTYNRLRWATGIALTLGSALFLVAGRLIIRIWAGTEAVPSFSLLALMCIWMVILGFTSNQACLMGATNRVRKQAVSSGLAAIANIVLSIMWIRPLGPPGVLLATIVSYLIFVLFVQALEVRSILKTESLLRSA